MHQALVFSHSYIRWLVLASLLIALYRAFRGYATTAAFSKSDNSIRHWTATIAHIQLMVGMLLYFNSPLVKLFWAKDSKAAEVFEISFFGMMHSSLMLAAIVLITIGSAKAKRAEKDKEKFKTMLVWFSIALAVIFIAIPWPFSPLADRPYFR